MSSCILGGEPELCRYSISLFSHFGRPWAELIAMWLFYSRTTLIHSTCERFHRICASMEHTVKARIFLEIERIHWPVSVVDKDSAAELLLLLTCQSVIQQDSGD